ncbi:MAG: hypothetical protein ACPHCN_16835 [Mycobacterium sp.]
MPNYVQRPLGIAIVDTDTDTVVATINRNATTETGTIHVAGSSATQNIASDDFDSLKATIAQLRDDDDSDGVDLNEANSIGGINVRRPGGQGGTVQIGNQAPVSDALAGAIVDAL